MKFIVDAQLPKTLSTLLNNLGADAIHTLDLPEQNRTGDDVIIKIADEEQRIVIMKDNDFLQGYLLQKKPPKLLMVNTGNIDNSSLLHLFKENFLLLTGLLTTNNYVELTRSEIIVHD